MTAPEFGNRIEWDAEVSGFGVRITAAGIVSFVLDYRIFGRQRRYTIGRYPELTATAARDEALTLKKRIREGHDPMEERKEFRSEPTLGDLAVEYMASEKAQKKRANSIRNDKRMLEKIIRPKIGKLRLRAIGRRDVEGLHTSLKDTPYQANRVLALLSAMFTYAIEDLKWLTTNPVVGIERYHEEKRERFLTMEEMRSFREALDNYHDQNAANVLRLLLLTGSRAGEVLKARWEEFDLDRGVWTKPSHHTKQKKKEHVPLNSAALDLLASMRPAKVAGPLFPGANGKARVTVRRPWVQACKAARLVEAITRLGKRRKITVYKPTVRVHDLRHNFASHLVSNGVSLEVVGKLLGHTQAATTMRYAHIQDDSLRAATNTFGKIIKFERKTA
jgi:integrase